jgi:hypothetical protein
MDKNSLRKFDVIGNNVDALGTVASPNEAVHNLKIKLITQDLDKYKTYTVSPIQNAKFLSHLICSPWIAAVQSPKNPVNKPTVDNSYFLKTLEITGSECGSTKADTTQVPLCQYFYNL